MTSFVPYTPIVDALAERAGQVLPGPEPDPPTPPDLPPDPKPPKPVHELTAVQRALDEAAVPVPLGDLVLRPVRLGSLRVGTVVDVVLSPGLRYVVGVDIVVRGCHRFLPWIALRPRRFDLALTSADGLDGSSALSRVLSLGTRLSQTAYTQALLVDRFGSIRRA